MTGLLIPLLRAWRLAEQLSVAELSQRAQVAASSIRRFERGGTARRASAARIATALGISLGVLMQEIPPEVITPETLSQVTIDHLRSLWREDPEPIRADTDVVMTLEDAVHAWHAITRPGPENVPLMFDPDDYPVV